MSDEKKQVSVPMKDQKKQENTTGSNLSGLERLGLKAIGVYATIVLVVLGIGVFMAGMSDPLILIGLLLAITVFRSWQLSKKE